MPRRTEPPVAAPGLPYDSQQVLLAFATAARAGCREPATIAKVWPRLQALAESLAAPESLAASECLRMWGLFARVAQVGEQALRLQAALAFCRDLDALGQRLDLPPLAAWEALPEAIDQALPPPVAASSAGISLEEAARRAAALQPLVGRAQSDQLAEVVAAMMPAARLQLFETMVGAGELGRSEVNLLVRFLLKGGTMAASEGLYRDIFARLGRRLMAAGAAGSGRGGGATP